MEIYTATNARANLFRLIESVSESHKPAVITSKKNNIVMISEEDFNAIQETLYLLSIPKMRESIIEGINTPLSDCIEEDKLDW